MEPVATFSPTEAAELRRRLETIADKGFIPAAVFSAVMEGEAGWEKLVAALVVTDQPILGQGISVERVK